VSRVWCWIGHLWTDRVKFVLNRYGDRIGYYSDAEYLARRRDDAHYRWGLPGIALWALGQEDTRLWERLAGGELPADTAVTV
jgi:spore germination protein YaaH